MRTVALLVLMLAAFGCAPTEPPSSGQTGSFLRCASDSECSEGRHPDAVECSDEYVCMDGSGSDIRSKDEGDAPAALWKCLIDTVAPDGECVRTQYESAIKEPICEDVYGIDGAAADESCPDCDFGWRFELTVGAPSEDLASCEGGDSFEGRELRLGHGLSEKEDGEAALWRVVDDAWLADGKSAFARDKEVAPGDPTWLAVWIDE